MARIEVYLNGDELAFVRAKGPGYVRGLVRGAMAGTPTSGRIVQGPLCKECGGMVMAGRCLVCKARQ